MAHTHPVVDSDSRFVINSTTREISTTSDKLELIQGDHQSERITFEIPKIVEGHDMSLSDRIEVHYINIDRRTNATSRDVYIIDDAAVDGDKLTFSWLISGNATKYYGRLNFVILFECLDPDGNYTYKWNTEICKLLTIGEGISNASAVIEDHSDILEKFKKEILEEAGEKNIQPDWNQNDSTQPDYVKNRPFYTGDSVETVLVEESTVSFASENGMYIGELESTFSPTVGETYKVSWDGTVYECTCVNFNGGPAIGNISIIGAGSDTGEPFIMYAYPNGWFMIVTADTSASHTFFISGIVEPIVKIPAKYIDKDASGYIVVHNSSAMTEEEAQNYNSAISKGEAVFIIWEFLYISEISVGTVTDSTGVSVVYLSVDTINGESYGIAQNSEGLFNLNDRKIYQATFPSNKRTGDVSSEIDISEGKIRISSSRISSGVGTTDALFYVQPNGTKSKAFEVLGNGEAVAQALILYSSTADSTKQFRVTVDDDYNVSATNISDSVSKALATTEYVDNSVSNPLNITSAAVGQIAKITAVDDTGKPTAWEAVDMPSGGGGIAVSGATVGQTVKISAVDEGGVPTAWEAVDFPSVGADGWELLTKNAETGEAEPIVMDAETLRYNFPSLADYKKLLIIINKKYVVTTGLTGAVWFRYTENAGFIFSPSYANNYVDIDASLPGLCALKYFESNNLQSDVYCTGTYTNVPSLESPYWVMPNADWAKYYADCNTKITIWGVRR